MVARGTDLIPILIGIVAVTDARARQVLQACIMADNARRNAERTEQLA